jgi:hypothetical protein
MGRAIWGSIDSLNDRPHSCKHYDSGTVWVAPCMGHKMWPGPMPVTNCKFYLYTCIQWRSQGGIVPPGALARRDGAMAPLVCLVRRPPSPAGSASGKIGGRSKKKVLKILRTRFYRSGAQRKFLCPSWVETWLRHCMHRYFGVENSTAKRPCLTSKNSF